MYQTTAQITASFEARERARKEREEVVAYLRKEATRDVDDGVEDPNKMIAMMRYVADYLEETR